MSFALKSKKLVSRKINPKADVEIPMSQTFGSPLFVLTYVDSRGGFPEKLSLLDVFIS